MVQIDIPCQKFKMKVKARDNFPDEAEKGYVAGKTIYQLLCCCPDIAEIVR
ncbi:hypothetical protein KCP77_05185 [Salmonella enterica subsp. enterica]|nr:hypothetical protein KCP77_05185 [Salmonella enterica subsp. enterica]